MVIRLKRGADLHMAQLMPLSPTVSCSSKIQIGFTFLVPAHPGSPGKRAVKRVCKRVCVLAKICSSNIFNSFAWHLKTHHFQAALHNPCFVANSSAADLFV